MTGRKRGERSVAKNKQWEDWKHEQVEAVPPRSRKRMKELLDSVPGPPAEWNGGIKKLREVGEEMREMVGGKDWRRKRGL